MMSTLAVLATVLGFLVPAISFAAKSPYNDDAFKPEVCQALCKAGIAADKTVNFFVEHMKQVAVDFEYQTKTMTAQIKGIRHQR